jgi:hypothetical protein
VDLVLTALDLSSLETKYVKPLSKIAFKLNLRHFSLASVCAQSAAPAAVVIVSDADFNCTSGWTAAALRM